MQKIEAITMELIRSGAADVDLVLEGVTCESLTEMKDNVLTAYKRKKSENDIIKQLQQQLADAQNSLSQLNQQATKLQQENESLKNKTSDIEMEKINREYEIKKTANDIKRMEIEKKASTDDKRIKLEGLQMFDNNPNNNEIRND